MSIIITSKDLLPVRRDKQVVSSVTTSEGTTVVAGGSGGGSTPVYTSIINGTPTAKQMAIFHDANTIEGTWEAVIGQNALANNVSGVGNIAFGWESLNANTTGNYNVSAGYGALGNNESGSNNIALGSTALAHNVSGYNNIAIGTNAHYDSDSAVNNIAIGEEALFYCSQGAENVAIGISALANLTNGDVNIAIGSGAGLNTNTVDPIQTNTQCIFIGNNSGSAYEGSHNEIVIGNSVFGAGNDTVTLGNGDTTDTYLKGLNHIPSANIGGDTNCVEILTDGEMTFKGTATRWDDLRIDSNTLQVGGANVPAMVSYTPSGSGGVVKLREFAKGDIAYFTCQIPHGYKVSSDIKVHLHWTPGAYGSAENGNTVGWKVLYSVAAINSNFGALATADLSDACDGTNHKHQMTPEVTITGTNFGISSMIIGQITRTDTGSDDTWTGTATGQLPLLLGMDFHIEMDTIGSKQSSSK